jgi:uncharacterized membrane protein YdbT with pleckstrin-like domain
MAYPRRLLKPGEEVLIDIRPHWVALTIPILITAALIAGLVLLFLLNWDGTVARWVRIVAVVAAVAVFAFTAGFRYVSWLNTEFVVTSDRVITRSGVFAKHARDIPLDRINDVTFTQSIIERVLGSGNIIIQSASEDGQNVFDFIRNPEAVHNQIYLAMEAEQERNRRVTLDPAQQAAAASAPDVPTQLTQLAALRDQGIITPQEFEDKKSELLRRL